MQMKTLTKGMLALLCAASLTACGDDDKEGPDSMYLYSTSATVEAAAGSKAVTIVTNRAWTATPAEKWVVASPASGSEKGYHEVTLSYEANTAAEPRSCAITFAGGTYKVVYTLTQKGAK